MARIIVRNTAISGSIPTSLVQGELSLNVTDGKLYYGSSSRNIVKEFTGSASGGTINTGSLLTTASFNAWTGSTTSYFAGTASFALTSSRAISASYATQALTASNADLLDGLHAVAFVLNSQTSSMSVATASFASTASFLNSTTNAFIQNGNSFGATAVLGTNDNQSLALETSGSTRMFISSSGNVGIGTITPTTTLDVAGSGRFTSGLTITGSVFFTGSGGGAPAVYIDNSLRVTRAGGSVGFIIDGALGKIQGGGNSVVYEPYNYADASHNFNIGHATVGNFNWSVGTNSTLSSNTQLMRLTRGGSLLIGTTTELARLQVRGAGTTSATTTFRVENSNASASFVVRDDIRVGIGTASPSVPLEVVGNTIISGSATIQATAGVILYNSNGYGGGRIYGSYGYLNGEVLIKPSGSITDNFIFSPNNGMSIGGYTIGGTAGSPPAYGLAVSGSVGIGTRVPSTTLDVVGSVNISGSGIQIPFQINATGTRILHVSSSGKISIGSSANIGNALEIYDTGIYYAGASSQAQLLITTSGSVNREGAFIAASSGRTLQMGINDNSTVPVGIDMFETNNSYPSTYLNFRVNNTDLVRMTGSFVGIGTTTPSTTLDVSGSARITNELTLSNYTNSGSFPGTGSALLAVNNSGSVITSPFLDVAEQVYTGSIAWTGTAAPSGSTTHTYRWSQVGKTVNLNITLVYTGPGNAVSTVTTALPADCPTPYVPSGQSGAGALISVVSAHLTTTTTIGANIARGGLRINSTNNGYELSATATAAGYKVLVTSVQYFAV